MAAEHRTRRISAGSFTLTTVLLVITGIVTAFAALLIWCRVNASVSDKIYPNVSACGINFGGMSAEEAAQKLLNSEYGAYNGKAVTIDFTTGYKLTISAEEAGLEADCPAAAERLYNFGRHDDMVKRTLSYLRCLFRPYEVFTLPEFHVDEENLRTLISKAADSVNIPVVQSVLFVDEAEIRYTRGKTGLLVDEAAVFGMVTEAFRNRDYKPRVYSPQVLQPDGVNTDEVYSLVSKEPVNASFDASFNILPEANGITFDLNSARSIFEKADYGQTVAVPLQMLKPDVFTDDLKALLYRDRLATVTTQLTNNETRSKNIQLAAGMIDGFILLPGKTFSYNDAVGERTVAKGYGAATAYSYGELVQQVGGGICQLSSTLYYCCLLADLEIVFRTGHIYYQTYVPYGMDATVSWGGPDYKFKNNTDYPIKICAWRSGSTITTEIWGTKTDGTYVKMNYEINESYPCGVTYTEDYAIPRGARKIIDNGRDGMKVTTYRCRYNAAGELLSRELEAVSYYSARNADIHVAPGEKPK